MLPIQRIDAILEQVRPDLRDIVLELRNIVARVAPSATETFRRNYFNYYFAEKGGPVSAGVCQVALYQDRVRLAFIHGAFLPDPQEHLKGDRLAKRYLDLYAYDQAPWEDLRELIAASASFDPRTLVW